MGHRNVNKIPNDADRKKAAENKMPTEFYQ